jgi:antitoxin CptB
MDILRKKLLFRAFHMGTHENDIFFGTFAQTYLLTMTDQELIDFQTLLEVNDPDLFLWITGAKPVPHAYNNKVFKMLQNFTLSQGPS